MTDRGSGSVELALLIPVLLLVGLALAEIASVARVQLHVAGAAREGARIAATSSDTQDAIRGVHSALGPHLASGAIVTVSRPAVVGAEASVEVSVVHRLAGALFGGAQLELRSQAVMRVES